MNRRTFLQTRVGRLPLRRYRSPDSP